MRYNGIVMVVCKPLFISGFIGFNQVKIGNQWRIRGEFPSGVIKHGWLGNSCMWIREGNG